jgi:hypothetical protein
VAAGVGAEEHAAIHPAAKITANNLRVLCVFVAVIVIVIFVIINELRLDEFLRSLVFNLNSPTLY